MEAVRSERKMDFTKSGDNNPEVGPGSYSTMSGPRSAKQQAAAFATGAPRECDAGAAKFITPGPGSYVSNESKLALGGFSSSTFKSDTKRFKPKACDGNPAPGAYHAAPGMGAKALQLAAKAAEADQPAVQWKRMQTAPSIPARHQSYGFRKSADRGIVALNNKEPAPSSTKPKASSNFKGVDWSKNKTERFPSKKSDKQPGPGAYSSGPETRVQRPAPQRSTGGQSYNEMLARKRLEEAAAVPGPGSYGVPDKSPFEQSLSLPGKGFGTTAERFQHKAQTGEIGPGQYNDSRKAINVKNSHPLATHITPFGTTSSRFGRSAADEKVPGPGSYVEQASSPEPAPTKLVGSFQGGFGSCSTRFSGEATNTSADVGPGTYDTVDRDVTKMLQKRRHNGMSSTFMSGNSRDKVVTNSLGLKGQSDQPGPGDYSVDPMCIDSTNMNASKPFGTSDQRWKAKKEDKFPPPGAYAAEKSQLSLPRRDRDGKPIQATKGAFNVNAPRFDSKPPGVGRRTKQPGPGQYAEGLEQATSGWKKHTYNITIRRSEMQANKIKV